MIGAICKAALAAWVIRWQAALVVGGLVALPLALPFVVIQMVTAFALTGGGDPVVLQHALWLLGSPEFAAVFFGGWLILAGPWAVGIWGASDGTQTRIWIGWQAYGRFLILLGVCVVISGLDALLLGGLDLSGEGGFVLELALEVLSNCAALYVLFRLAAAAVEVRAGRNLALRTAWRQSAEIGGRLLGLSALWIAVALVFSVVAEALGLVAHLTLSNRGGGTSGPQFLIPLVGAGVVKGLMAVLVAVMTLALFWAVAERAAADGDQ
ncbi:hypothetical protein K3728_10620 [Rhodobacteraceae bacterium M385]|nr:hypothetical protein K3728_10620 [Rhodobacteraceae bacterium M385]